MQILNILNLIWHAYELSILKIFLYKWIFYLKSHTWNVAEKSVKKLSQKYQHVFKMQRSPCSQRNTRFSQKDRENKFSAVAILSIQLSYGDIVQVQYVALPKSIALDTRIDKSSMIFQTNQITAHRCHCSHPPAFSSWSFVSFFFSFSRDNGSWAIFPRPRVRITSCEHPWMDEF